MQKSKEETPKKRKCKDFISKIFLNDIPLWIYILIALSLIVFIVCAYFSGSEIEVFGIRILPKPRKIQVEITGEVNEPSVYEMKRGSCLADLVDKAGGFTNNADKESLNMAIALENGSQYEIPSIIKITVNPKYDGIDIKINLNTATIEELDDLPMIGEKLAQAIIDYREQEGPFKDITEIKYVYGIGDGIFEIIKDQISVED
jgi:competence protein ComEA